MKPIILLALALILTGCLSTDVQKYGTIDKSNKTIQTPSGSNSFNRDLKKALLRNGWTVTSTSDDSQSTYRLLTTSFVSDYCISMTPAIAYEVFVIENETDQELLTLSGRDCQRKVVALFEKNLNELEE